jgi:long-chain acyl-CoA synthetase
LSAAFNIVRAIREQRHAEQIAILGEGREIRFGDLFAAVDEIKGWLLSHPRFQGDGIPRVGIVFPNGSAYIAVALAVLDAGGCFVPIPDELTPAEQETLCSETALHLVIRGSESGWNLPLALGHAEMVEQPSIPTKFPEADFEKLNPAFIRFSSGTTGSAKGVVLSHQSLLERITAANRGLQLKAGDRVLWTLPMAHHFAVTIILYLYHGVTTVLETSHRPEELYRAARKSGTHLFYGSPLHFAQLAQCCEADPLPDLRMAISTATALSEGTAKAFEKRFEIPLTQALGIIEVGLPLLNLQHASDRPTALGQPLPDYEVKASPSGELLLRGPGMFDAYLTPWRPRDTILQGGWFATGDLVEISGDQTVTLLGRSKSVINVGGMKVFPEEIEAVLDHHPAIRRSKVRAEAHLTLGAFPSAEIEIQDGAEAPSVREIRAYCLDKLTAYKIPMRVDVVPRIDLTASGKVRRH